MVNPHHQAVAAHVRERHATRSRSTAGVLGSRPPPLPHRTCPRCDSGIQPKHAPDRSREAQRRGLPTRTARGGRAPLAPTLGCVPDPPGLATLADRRRPLGLDPPATPPGRRPGPPGAPAVIGLLTAHRQRRRRITPNTNTSTTTMISTHNHVDMAASLVGAGAVRGDATAAHPSKQLGHGHPGHARPRLPEWPPLPNAPATQHRPG